MNRHTPKELHKFGRYFAIETNNAFWTMSEKELNTEDKKKLLELAFASLYHWQAVGTERNVFLAQLNVARALCINDVQALGLEYAQNCFAFFENDDEKWIIAFAEIILSHAHFNLGDHDQHRFYHERALATADQLGAEDRQIFDATADRIPAP